MSTMGLQRMRKSVRRHLLAQPVVPVMPTVFTVAAALVLACGPAIAYGPAGHLIAGRAAAPLLCEQAAAEVAHLGDGQDLGELGLWADRVRSDPAYADSGPWHYMNIADGVPLSDFIHPPEGDVLWAVTHFAAVLDDTRRRREERGVALRFLVHFVVDLHQPLHVGRAEDRGGNEISVVVGGDEINLHRFWDSTAIDLAERPLSGYVSDLGLALAADNGPEARSGSQAEVRVAMAATDPRRWAEESLALRPAVYDFEPGRALTARYLAFAATTTRERLGLASRRLAATLNGIYCR
jgi:hypothetical protein